MAQLCLRTITDEFDYEMYVPSDRQLGAVESGTWTGTIGELQDNVRL